VDASFSPITVLVDASRFLNMFRDMSQFLIRQIVDADIVAINKIDLLSSPYEADVVADSVKQINSRCKVIPISAKTGEGVDKLMNMLLSAESGLEVSEEMEYEDSEEASGMSVYEVKVSVESDSDVYPSEWEKLMTRIIEDIAIETADLGARHIGHIKGVFNTPRGIVRGSLVDIDQGVDILSTLKEPVDKAELVINAIVSDIDKEELKDVVLDVLDDALRKFRYELHEHVHEHHHD